MERADEGAVSIKCGRAAAQPALARPDGSWRLTQKFVHSSSSTPKPLRCHAACSWPLPRSWSIVPLAPRAADMALAVRPASLVPPTALVRRSRPRPHATSALLSRRPATAASCAIALLRWSTAAAAVLPAAIDTEAARSSMEAGKSRLRTWHQPAGCSRNRRSKGYVDQVGGRLANARTSGAPTVGAQGGPRAAWPSKRSSRPALLLQGPGANHSAVVPEPAQAAELLTHASVMRSACQER